MDTSRWIVFVLCFQFKAVQTNSSPWTLHMPTSVQGLPGSCVLVPCSFNYPPPRNTVHGFTGIWMDDSNHIVYHPVESKILRQYRGRTAMMGDVQQRNCSLKIDPMQQSDHGPFHFRIEMAGSDKYSYMDNKVSVSTKRLNPIQFSLSEEVEEGQNVSVSCSVVHSCPPHPPVFTWSHSGDVILQSKELGDGQWEVTSTLTFRSTRADHRKPVRCNVEYKGGMRQETHGTLLVKYAPDIKPASHCSPDGGGEKCVCIVESSPASTVHFIILNRNLQSTNTETYGTLTYSTLQINSSFSEPVTCYANNTQGITSLALSVPANNKMLYVYLIAGAVSTIFLVVLSVTAAIVKHRGKSGDTSDTSPVTTEKSRKDNTYFAQCSATVDNEPIYLNTGNYDGTPANANM